METKSWDELEETDPQRAEAYRDAIAELTDWVIKRARAGDSDVFSDAVDQIMVISRRRGLPDEMWDYLDWDGLFFAIM
jgi:hypothetical protein